MSHRVLMLFGLSLILFMDAASQTTEYAGVRIPRDFKVMNGPAQRDLAKAFYDTLRYITFTKTKQDFVVNTGSDSAGSNQWRVTVASDPRGWALCAWNDERAGDQQVDAQLFDNAGNRIGPVIHVSQVSANWNSEPHITYNRISNEYLVLWAGNGYNIRFQRISASGQMVGSNITANQQQLANTNNPSAAVDSSGNFIITWYSDATAALSDEVVCRVFDREGIPISNEWFPGTSGLTTTSVGWEDRIASDSSGRCIVVWSCRINGHSRIVLQSVSRSGNVYPEPIVVSSTSDTSDYYFPTIRSTRDGHFLITWDSLDHGVYGRIFHPDSGFITPQVRITNQGDYWVTWDISSDDHRFFVAWASDRVYGRVLSTQGQFIGGVKSLPVPQGITSLQYPRLSNSVADKLYLVYYVYARLQQDVMLQAIDVSFNPLGNPVKAADDGRTGAWQVNPVVKYNQQGRSLIVWEDRRNGWHQVYGQVLDESGNPVSENLKISPDTIEWTSKYSIACDKEGNFLVSFRGGDYSSGNLIVQKVSPSGTLIGSNVQISRNLYFQYREPENAIQISENGELLAWWYTDYSLTTDRLGSNLESQRVRTTIFSSSLSQGKRILGVSTNRHFNFLVLWRDYDYSTYQAGNVLKAILLDERGKKLCDTMAVVTLPENKDVSLCACRVDDDHNMLFAWNTYDRFGSGSVLNIKRLYRADNSSYTDAFSIDWNNTRLQIVRFDSKQVFVAWDSYAGISAVYMSDTYAPYNRGKSAIRLQTLPTSNTTPGESHSIFCTDVNRNNLLLARESSEIRDRGFDIYASVQNIDAMSFPEFFPTTESVASAYPNPSSQSVQLQYEVTQPTHVYVSVYNILGQKIADIENAIKQPGIYTVQFPTNRLASGVYYFYYHGLKTYAKKFMVVK